MKHAGFTLIELLIVVAIIAILAAIAVPNFLEAQTRSKVARVKSDMRTLSIGVEVYHVDNNAYPKRHYGSDNPESDTDHWVPDLATRLEDMHVLTTPIAYISSLPVDVFDKTILFPFNILDYYDTVQTWRSVNYWPINRGYRKNAPAYMLLSVGPDGHLGVLSGGGPGGYPPETHDTTGTFFDVYDSTNGTVSAGNIFRPQNNAEFESLRW